MDDVKERVSLDDRLDAAATTGMTLAVWAALKPNATFVHDPTGKTTTFGEVNANANRIVRLLRRHGLKAARRCSASSAWPRPQPPSPSART